MVRADAGEKTAKGLEYKDSGNKHFQAGEYAKAIKEYHFALLYMRGLGDDPLTMSAPKDPAEKKEEEVTELEKGISNIHSNMALCHLRLGNHASTIRCANEAIKVNPFNHKAKFRLAQGLIREGAIIKAEKLLGELEKASPDDPAFAAERRNIEAMEKKAEAKQRKEFGGMFDRASKDADSDDEE
ncbi:hypothetical protein LPJ61_000587 [Coemansia biformis]|uniref:TPR-like protein n=1 Tax=Coemansia biformis TaxID=1286918 RepID=A0A9W7YIE7_9FUNG|nr:hypothetical protein LPJ61_000587 [Coemansia biformis]